MVMQPKVLVLDEPTSQLDPITASEFIDTLVKINRELGTTIILSEHRLEDLFPAADRILVMSEGSTDIFDTPSNVGNYLSRDGKRHEMYYGLPAIMKIYTEIGEHRAYRGCPITVKEGRYWLRELLGDQISCNSVKELEGKKKTVNRQRKKRAGSFQTSESKRLVS